MQIEAANGIGPTILGGVVTDQNGITLHYIKLTRVRFKALHSQNCNLPVVFSERPFWVISLFFFLVKTVGFQIFNANVPL
jgi:hypothetical protein